jgi:hypothetical protein
MSVSEKFLEISDLIIYSYVRPILAFLIFITNFVCFIIFCIILKEHRQNGNKMYHYLLIKSACDSFLGLIESFYPLYSLEVENVSDTLIIILWYIYCHKYLREVIFLISALLEVVANIDCAISIDKNMRKLQTKSAFICINIVIFVFGLVYNFYNIFAYKIQKNIVNQLNVTIVRYTKNDTVFRDSKAYLYLDNVNSILKDFVVIIILVLINIYMLVKMKSVRKRKENLLKKDKKGKKTAKNKSKSAENRKVKMIYTLCLIYIFGHLPNILYTLNIYETESYLTSVLAGLTDTIHYFSYTTFLFVYYHFNVHFHAIFNKYFLFCKKNNAVVHSN